MNYTFISFEKYLKDFREEECVACEGHCDIECECLNLDCKCDICYGTGYIPCEECDGEGVLYDGSKRSKVKIFYDSHCQEDLEKINKFEEECNNNVKYLEKLFGFDESKETK